MPKCNQRCKKCGDLFYMCVKCDKDIPSKEGFCCYECWDKQPLLDKLEQTGQYEAVEEINRLNKIIDEMESSKR